MPVDRGSARSYESCQTGRVMGASDSTAGSKSIAERARDVHLLWTTAHEKTAARVTCSGLSERRRSLFNQLV